MLAVFKREFKSYFSSPLGYIFLAAMYLFGGYFFYVVLKNNSSNLSFIFASLLQVVVIVVPLLTMRLLSEDKRQKTDQLLLTSPVKTSGIVLGKYCAAFVVYLMGISCTLVYGFVMSTITKVNWNVFLGNFLGILLLGASLIAIGILISSLTESQMIAAIVTYAIMLFILMFDSIFEGVTVPFITKTLSYLSFTNRYQDLVGGIMNVSHIIFFGSFAVLFNFLTVRTLERKRWS
ncbi:MAG: ABC transporter permease subunit [Oscillospiraceae bacterium]